MADEIQQARIEIARTRNIPPEQVPQKQAEQRILSQKTTLPKPQLSVTVAPPKPTSTNYNTADYVATPQGQLVSKADVIAQPSNLSAELSNIRNQQQQYIQTHGRPSPTLAAQEQRLILQMRSYQPQNYQTPTITLSSGEQVSWNVYKDLPPDTQKLLLESGSIEAYNAAAGQMAIQAETEFSENTIQLPSGEYVSKDAYNSLTEEQKQVLFDEGVGALQGLLDVQQYAQIRAIKNAEISNAEAQARYDAHIAALPEADQRFIAANGIEAYNSQIERQNAAIQASLDAAKDYITTNDDGTQSIDIVRALNGDDEKGIPPVSQADLKNLGITDQQISDAYMNTPGFNAAPITAEVRGKIGGHEVFEELIPYTNSTGTQVNAVQYLVDTKLDPNSVKVLQQVIPDNAVASSLQSANAITIINDYAGDVVQLARDMPTSSRLLLQQAGFDENAIATIEGLAADTTYVTPTYQKKEPQNIWQSLTPWNEGSGETFGSWVGQTAEQFKQNFLDNLTGKKADYWLSAEGQAELKTMYDAQNNPVDAQNLGDFFSNFGRSLKEHPVVYDGKTGKYYLVKSGYIDITPAGGWGSIAGKSQQVVSKVVKETKLLDAADLGVSQSKFLDFLRLRAIDHDMTWEQFSKLDDLKLASLLKNSKATMTDMEVWLRAKDLNKAWNEVVLRNLMDRVLTEQQQSAKLAAAARELKETGQVTLQIPQIGAKGVNTALVILATGKVTVPAIENTIDVVANIVTQQTKTTPITGGSIANITSVPIPIPQKPILLPTTKSTVGVSTDVATEIKPTISTEIFPSTQPVQQPQVKPMEQPAPQPTITTQPQPLPEIGIFGDVFPETQTQTDTETATELDVQTSTLPVTTTEPINAPTPAPVPQPFPKPIPQPQPIKPPVEEYNPPPPPEDGDKKTPTPFIPDEDKKREDWEEEYSVDGSIAWKQGFGWWVIKPPYKGREDMHFFYGNPPEGVHAVEGGAESAFKSIQSFGGVVPDNLLVDLGIMNIKISNPKGTPGAGKIEYDEDERQAKHWAREPYGKRSFTEEVEQAPARRNIPNKMRKVDTIEEIDETGRYYLGRRLPDNIDLT